MEEESVGKGDHPRIIHLRFVPNFFQQGNLDTVPLSREDSTGSHTGCLHLFFKTIWQLFQVFDIAE